MMMKKVILSCVAALWAVTCLGYRVSVGTFVSNAGRQVTVPIEIDTVAGLSYAGATITYDPQVLVVTKTEAGTLRGVMADDFTSTDTNGTLTVTIFGGTQSNVVSGAGSIAKVTFAIREGTAGLYSDLAVTDVSLGEKTGLKDVTVGNPVTTQNGMVRVMAANAAVDRLENAETICAESALGALTLQSGDGIQASGAQTNAIRIAGAVTAAATIPVMAPVNGWASGTYALLSTTTEGLSFALDGIEGEITSSKVNGTTTYYATIQVEGEIELVCDDEALSADSKNQIRDLVADKLTAAVKRIRVTGPSGSVATIADMGIAPAVAPVDATGTLNLVYAMPTLTLTSFEPTTGAVRFKVTPAAGNQIVSEIATGYIHVYGTDSLGDPMRYISKVGFDLTPYLKADTKGEGVINVTLGTHTFLKVKIENASKREGDVE